MSPHEPDRAVPPSEVLASLGLRLPSVSPPKGRYVPAVVSGRFVFVAGQIPLADGRLVATGRVGGEVPVALARELSRRCALASLAAVDAVAGIDRVTRIVKVTGYVAVAPGFRDLDAAVDGASALYEAVFGARGAHARAVVGVADLPLNTPVEIETLVEIDR
ncbi:RidA family protein [Streptomyces sp. NPDC090994]|uniref:RidA family protein n=1 Tax=Streptomyces sp. NPDC090994 TaxID=3365969 RepID=UPI003806DE2C